MQTKLAFRIFLALSVLCGLGIIVAAGQAPSVLGSWRLEITVPPQPTADNTVTFKGATTGGEFTDKNGHSGTWKLDGKKIVWEYKSVPGLVNVFSGEISDDGKSMSGTNSGTWQGTEFKGTWKGVASGEQAKSETDKWREDVRFLAAEFPRRHKNLFFRMTREEFAKTVNELDGRIPNLTRNQIAMEIARIVAMVGDGHTSFFPMFSPELKFRTYPMRLYSFKDGIYVRNAPPESTQLVGAKLVRIGKMTTDQAVERVTPYIPHENVMWIREFAPIYLACPEVIEALGIASSGEEVEYLFEKDGKTTTVKLKPDGILRDVFEPEGQKGWIDANGGPGAQTPLWLKEPNVPLRFEYDSKTRIFYVRMNQVLGMQGKTMAQFWTEVVAAAKASEAEKFVLDIRANGGGNNGLVPPIIRGLIQLEKFDQKGKLFVIIGRQTFSAAQNLVNSIETYTNAVFVGEPTGNRVNMYGDARPFNLPNSGLRIQASTLWWQNMVELDRRQWTAPHVSAGLTFADYKNNIDPAIEAVAKYTPRPTLTELVRADFEAGNIAAVKAKLVEFRKDPANEYVSVEAELNAAGYRLLGARRVEQAIQLFKLNTELYPDSANVYDSLGEAYETAGNKEEAIKAYEQALKIIPDYPSSVAALKRLKGN